MTYDETIDWLFQQFPAYHIQGVSAYKPSLDNIKALSAAFGNPERSLRFVHIAGTNGKGSVSNMLASMLTQSGERTGLFTSPHIHDFTERIRVNGETVSEEFVIEFCRQVRKLKLDLEPSFFEITWLMALCRFREQQCTVVVAETGLGGRLDATNIIMPVVSVITNISLDHTNILGNTRPLIAAEKAGIIKPGIPVVLGETDPETFPVFESFASQNHSTICQADSTISYPKEIIGYQKENFATVARTLDILNNSGFRISPENVQRGIQNLRANTGFMGRMEIVGQHPLIIIDCAHNVAGIEKTLAGIRELIRGKLHIVYGTSSDKNLEDIATVLPAEATYYFTTFTNPRSAGSGQLNAVFANRFPESAFFTNAVEAFDSAKQASGENDTILIFGSFFLIHEFYDLISPAGQK